ncbi:MAG: polysaccharide pyruvyl transferase family protein [Paraglaciecola sp.]|nr:polysaccharide pyruvyl transferase family protein [Paraglaciecola sp.]
MSIIKTLVRNFILNLLALYLRCFSKRAADQVALIAPPIPCKNLGDQALLLGSLHELLSNNKKVSVIQIANDSCSEALTKAKVKFDKQNIHDEFMAAFVSDNSFTERWRLLKFMASKAHCYVIGADVLDGTYNPSETKIIFDMCLLLSKSGVSVNLISASFSKNIANEAKQGLRSINNKVKLYCRDYYSQQRVKQFCDADLSADVAFLMPPSTILSGYSEPPEMSGLTIGLCLKNTDLNNQQNKQAFLDEIERFASLNSNINFIALPHFQTDFEELQNLAALSDVLKRYIIMPHALPSAPDIKNMAMRCDFVITGRMHVAIAAISQGVPVLCLSYGDKFAGLLRHFSLPEKELVLEGFNAVQFHNSLKLIAAKYTSFRETILANKETVLKLARSNFE